MGQEISCLILNLKFHYHIQMSLSLNYVLYWARWIRSTHSHPIFLKICFNVIHRRLHLQNHLFFWVYRIKFAMPSTSPHMLHLSLHNFNLSIRMLIKILMSSTDGLESMEDCLLQLHTINRVNDLTKNSSKSSMIFKIINKALTNIILISEWNLSSLRKSTLRYAHVVPFHEYVLFSAKNTLGTLHTQHAPSQLSWNAQSDLRSSMECRRAFMNSQSQLPHESQEWKLFMWTFYAFLTIFILCFP
jgi:hypothetical protein